MLRSESQAPRCLEKMTNQCPGIRRAALLAASSDEPSSGWLRLGVMLSRSLLCLFTGFARTRDTALHSTPAVRSKGDSLPASSRVSSCSVRASRHQSFPTSRDLTLRTHWGLNCLAKSRGEVLLSDYVIRSRTPQDHSRSSRGLHRRWQFVEEWC